MANISHKDKELYEKFRQTGLRLNNAYMYAHYSDEIGIPLEQIMEENPVLYEKGKELIDSGYEPKPNFQIDPNPLRIPKAGYNYSLESLCEDLKYDSRRAIERRAGFVENAAALDTGHGVTIDSYANITDYKRAELVKAFPKFGVHGSQPLWLDESEIDKEDTEIKSQKVYSPQEISHIYHEVFTQYSKGLRVKQKPLF